MPPLMGMRAATARTGGNLAVTALVANLGGLALHGRSGAGQGVLEAALIQTQEQIQLMAQPASLQLSVAMSPQNVLPKQQQQQNRPRPVAAPFVPRQQIPQLLQPPVRTLMQFIAQPQQIPIIQNQNQQQFQQYAFRIPSGNQQAVALLRERPVVQPRMQESGKHHTLPAQAVCQEPIVNPSQ